MYEKIDLESVEDRYELYDLVITNGLVVDPRSEKTEMLNVGIKNGKIAALTIKKILGKKVISAKNSLVTPGFIDFHSHVDGNPYAARCIARQGGTTTLGGERCFDGNVIHSIEEEGFLINHGFFISHSFTLRAAAGIKNPYVQASKNEIETMVNLAEEFLVRGAFGVHLGLEFFPGTSFEEIINMANITKKYNRVMPVHLRKDGKEALKYFDEIIDATKITGVSTQISQLMYMVGIGGAMSPALEMIEKARANGLDITADSGVYDAFSACIGTSIFDPGWEFEYGGFTTKDLLISSGIYTGECCNDALFYYLREEFPNTLVTAFVCDTKDIMNAIKKDYVYVSTNAADGPFYPGMGHPEVAGTFPRLIGRYVREKNELKLLEALKKITYLPAKRFGIKNKGWIGIGADADLVIFNYEQIIDTADYLGSGDPDAPPEGIKYVIVNGEIIVEENVVYEHKKPGKLLKAHTAD